MARRVLSASSSSGAIATLCLGLALGACKRAPPAPAPAPADSATESARGARFDSELKRTRSIWQESPTLGNCSDILHETSDAALCQAAASALSKVQQQDATATTSAVLGALSDASLALVRLVERARYLSLEELGHQRLEDAGSPHVASPSSSAAPPASGMHAGGATPLGLPQGMHNMQGMMRDRAKLKLADSPVARLVQNAARLEHDVLRSLSAYLEYAPLPIRNQAFDAVKQLQAKHPQWPALNHVLREAAVLETDAALKQRLTQAELAGAPPAQKLDQPTGSK